jgi:L-malate glycosyltransferase
MGKGNCMVQDTDIKVLHIDSEKSWRGGQQQAAYLLERMTDQGFDTAMVCKPDSAMERVCRGKALPVHTLPMHGELDVVAGYRVASLCRKKGYTILHLHSAHAMATGLWAKMFYGKLKLIGVRRVAVPIKKNWLSRIKYTTPQMDCIVCISEAIKNQMLSDGVTDDKLTVIHSGIHLDRFRDSPDGFDTKRSLGIPENNLVVGTVAAFTREKDYPTLMKAAQGILGKHKDITFCAVGSGVEEAAVHDLARELGLGKGMVFTGFREDVGTLLKMFDLFVLPSYLEGLGSSILDAQALGLPVIACRTGGIPEIVFDGMNGRLIQPRDPEALKDAIDDLVCAPEKRQQWGNRALETVQAFSIDQTVEKNIALYSRLMSERSELP